MDELTGKVALITGAGRGFGFATAERFAEAGAELALNYRGSREGCEAIASRLKQAGHRALVVQADMTDGEAIAKMAQRILEAFGRVDILVNNAGVLFHGPFNESREQDWRAEIEVMPDRATFAGTFVETAREAGAASGQAADRARLAVAAMRQRGGEAVEIRSTVSMVANYTEYRNRQGEVEQREGAENIRSYTAEVRLDVEVKELPRAGAVRAAALAVGPENAEALNYSLRLTGEHNRRVFAAAAADAAARARTAAEATGTPLGRLLALQEGQGPCLGQWWGARPGMVGAPAAPMRGRASQGAIQDSPMAVTSVGGRELRLTQAEIDRLDLPADVAPIRLQAQVCAVYATGG